MVRTVRVQIDGLKELEKALAEFSKSLGRATLRRALAAAAKPLEEQIRDNAPIGPTGNLWMSIGTSTKLSPRQAKLQKKMPAEQRNKGATMFVGPDARAAGRHAHLVEFGTGERVVKKTGRRVGRMPPGPFVRPAWDSQKMNVLKKIREELASEIEKTAARQQRRMARRAIKGATKR